MYLDKFQDLLAEFIKHEDDGLGKTYQQHLLAIITPETLPNFLSLFEQHHSPLTQGKISYLISEALQSNRAKLLVESLINAEDAKSLSLLAYGMSFFNDVPLDIMPYDEEKYELLSLVSIFQQSSFD
jgi:hypothetical protein